MAANLQYAYADFAVAAFCAQAEAGLEDLALMQRAEHIAQVMRRFLPSRYSEAIGVLIASMTEEHTQTEGLGLAGFFYLPHSFFIALYGQDFEGNGGEDPFDVSMSALLALTTRFTAEFAIRPFLIQQQTRVLAQLMDWLVHPNPHVRRLCSEGTRPKLPWGKRLPALIADPRPNLPILEALYQDSSLYVRRSVANHLGDIAKDHPDIVYDLCTRWLETSDDKQVRWVVRHALRHPAKKGAARAMALRNQH